MIIKNYKKFKVITCFIISYEISAKTIKDKN